MLAADKDSKAALAQVWQVAAALRLTLLCSASGRQLYAL